MKILATILLGYALISRLIHFKQTLITSSNEIINKAKNYKDKAETNLKEIGMQGIPDWYLKWSPRVVVILSMMPLLIGLAFNPPTWVIWLTILNLAFYALGGLRASILVSQERYILDAKVYIYLDQLVDLVDMVALLIFVWR